MWMVFFSSRFKIYLLIKVYERKAMKVIEHLEKAKNPLFSYEIIPPLRGNTIKELLIPSKPCNGSKYQAFLFRNVNYTVIIIINIVN